jgi:hypothetical protein
MDSQCQYPQSFDSQGNFPSKMTLGVVQTDFTIDSEGIIQREIFHGVGSHR